MGRKPTGRPIGRPRKSKVTPIKEEEYTSSSSPPVVRTDTPQVRWRYHDRNVSSTFAGDSPTPDELDLPPVPDSSLDIRPSLPLSSALDAPFPERPIQAFPESTIPYNPCISFQCSDYVPSSPIAAGSDPVDSSDYSLSPQQTTSPKQATSPQPTTKPQHTTSYFVPTHRFPPGQPKWIEVEGINPNKIPVELKFLLEQYDTLPTCFIKVPQGRILEWRRGTKTMRIRKRGHPKVGRRTDQERRFCLRKVL